MPSGKRNAVQPPSQHRRITPQPPIFAPPRMPTPPPPPPSPKNLVEALEVVRDWNDSIVVDMVRILMRKYSKDKELFKGIENEMSLLKKKPLDAVENKSTMTDNITNTTDTGINTEGVPCVEVGTNTVPQKKKTYADVASSSGPSDDKMEVDLPSSSSFPDPNTSNKTPNSEKKKTTHQTHTNTRIQPPRPQNNTTPLKKRAIVVHGVRTNKNLTSIIRSIEGQARRVAIGGRWLLSKDRRQGKIVSSVVLFFYEEIIVRDLFLWVRKHRVEEYEWGRKGKDREG